MVRAFPEDIWYLSTLRFAAGLRSGGSSDAFSGMNTVPTKFGSLKISCRLPPCASILLGFSTVSDSGEMLKARQQLSGHVAGL